MRLVLLLVKWYQGILNSRTKHCIVSIDLRTVSTVSNYKLNANILVTLTLHK